MSVTSSSRRAVTDALLELAEKDKRIVFVSSDSVGVIKAQDFAEKYPERTVEMGISEQAAMDTAGGLASTGLKPVYVSYAVFASMRACEQFRSIICYSGLNVIVVGANGGMGAGEREGVSHMGCEDISILRSFPNLTILVPSDAQQVRKAMLKAAELDGPVYIRTGSGKEALYHSEDVPFEIGPPRQIAGKGSDITLFGCGFIMPILEKACSLLEEKGIPSRVVEVPTVKPLDKAGIEEYLGTSKAAVTVEDHTVIGGLGSAIAELNVQSVNVPMRMVGIQDVFAESGTAEELFEKYGITVETIVTKAEEALR